jgi:uncharacterized Fe-S cluster-containing radical SAM superfamily protein
MSIPGETYQRYLEPGFTPFDPLELARQTEKIVCRGDQRKYTKFYCTGVYGGIATGFTCGCCLRCIFCWVNWSRDFPEKYGVFRSPEEAFRQLSRVARKAGVDQLRISGAEPTLGKSHLLGLLKRVEDSPFRLFILETNGILIGADPDYALQIARFKKVHTRVSNMSAEAFWNALARLIRLWWNTLKRKWLIRTIQRLKGCNMPVLS